MEVMTDKQMEFITWLITTATDKCQTVDEVSFLYTIKHRGVDQ